VKLLDSYCKFDKKLMKSDNKIPKGYLADSKANLNSFLELFGEGEGEVKEEQQ